MVLSFCGICALILMQRVVMLVNCGLDNSHPLAFVFNNRFVYGIKSDPQQAFGELWIVLFAAFTNNAIFGFVESYAVFPA
jgi:hypothetical protein